MITQGIFSCSIFNQSYSEPGTFCLYSVRRFEVANIKHTEEFNAKLQYEIQNASDRVDT
jgi:hypothetical protein